MFSTFHIVYHLFWKKSWTNFLGTYILYNFRFCFFLHLSLLTSSLWCEFILCMLIHLLCLMNWSQRLQNVCNAIHTYADMTFKTLCNCSSFFLSWCCFTATFFSLLFAMWFVRELKRAYQITERKKNCFACLFVLFFPSWCYLFRHTLYTDTHTKFYSFEICF